MNAKPTHFRKTIVVAVALLSATVTSLAGMRDPEGPRKDWREPAERESRQERDRADREMAGHRERPEQVHTVPEVIRPTREPQSRPTNITTGGLKTTYLKEPDGGYTVVQSNRGGSTVTTLHGNGQVQHIVTSNSPKHAEYVEMQQRGGAMVISSERAQREIHGASTSTTARAPDPAPEREPRDSLGAARRGF